MVIDHSRRAFFKAKANSPLRPPYSGNEDAFLEACTQCHKCTEVCETGIIKQGAGGFPEIDFAIDECTFCDLCSEVCQTKALNNKLQPAFNNQISIASNCLAVNKVHCMSCKDVCEPEAIKFDLFKAALPTPEITLADCTSCGACVSVCPQNSIEIKPSQIL
ncbi:ferredoxin-type protein NapF [Pseudoalteromonas sp. NBT06-2]|uniref:ferredoxin-type protein NapF n=1 Tax=Pseudoalteromonas sp. NBT06-2 TaxID=2025950 RepID=UPI000BA5D914|nr:ferredoxin-type protein NapF [Pseudoalteromonas sp. NBT06-2]PAJ73084.1 ferredoxin-type protein NapF [Pseudoalteromonas sp. NBT06-2]